MGVSRAPLLARRREALHYYVILFSWVFFRALAEIELSLSLA